MVTGGTPLYGGGRQDFTSFNLDPALDKIVKTRKVMAIVISIHVSVYPNGAEVYARVAGAEAPPPGWGVDIAARKDASRPGS